MNSPDLPAYGHWSLVIINTLIILIFAFSFFKPKTKIDWRTFGSFSAFIIALFTEMFGFPLSIYLLSGWLQKMNPDIDWFSHNSSHLLQTLLGWEGDAHINPLHIASNILLITGIYILYSSWKILYNAQKNNSIASTGPYALVKHPQYSAFILIMISFLIQWPTIPTLIMFPVLVYVYTKLAKKEEKDVVKEYGDEYLKYTLDLPAFFPKILKRDNN